jgi:hypothetical protein
MTNPRDPRDEHTLQTELDQRLAERGKVRSDLHNTGDLKYQERLKALENQILMLESAIGDARV